MTLEEFKIKVYSLIEEYNEDEEDLTEDQDLANKMNSVINQVMNEICRFKKISAYKTMEIKFEEGQSEKQIHVTDVDKDIYQINIIRGIENYIIDKEIIFSQEGIAKIYYYKYPAQIDQDTEDDYEFELDTDAIECMVYGVAGDLLLPDVASQFGNKYRERYQELLQRLDSRNSMDSVYIDGGVEI